MRAVAPQRRGGDLSSRAVDGDHLLHDLDETQRRAVTSRAQPLAILAPAGSGKTRVLTRRIAWRVATDDADPGHVLALTFTRKAAGELRDRLRALGLRDGVAAGTFHGVAWAQLRARWSDEGRTPPQLLVRKGRLIGDLLRRSGGVTIPQLATEVEWAKARLVGPDRYAEATVSARRRTPAPPDRIAELYAAYEDEKRKRRLVDFDDLLRLCSHLLETDASFAATQRWRFRHLFVDEFQDVNPLQMQLLEAWRGNRWDLCVVGDPHQAIYGWNGADAGFLEGFQRRYPPAEVILLDRNYRSTPQVLNAAADVLAAAKVGDRAVKAIRPDGRMPRLERHPTDRDEAVAIARAVRDRRAPGSPWGAQAVLTRTHAQLPVIAEALRLAGVPHRVRGGADLLARPEVRACLDVLRHGERLLAGALPDLKSLAADMEADRSEEADAVANVDLVVRCAYDHLRLDPAASSMGFLGWLVATLEAEGAEAGRDAVTLATFHAAKGLEWPVVHLAGLEDGYVPISHARTREARTEEARLLYVAMTRAEDELRCTWAASRDFGGKLVERRLSPWLGGLSEAQRARPDAGTGGPPDDWRLHLAAQRRELAAATASIRPAPSGALAALHEWRDEAARAARVDPHTLLDDRLLEAIVERRPTSTDELAEVPGMGRLLAARVGDGLLAALGTAEAHA
jgi:DNA helicase-2/ATP-dependent DNA helicase PcrA